MRGRQKPPPATPSAVRVALRWLRAATGRGEIVQPLVEIDAVAAEPALGQNRRDIGRLAARAETMRIHDHARKPRRQRQRAQTFAFSGDAAIGIERAEFAQQATGLVQRRRGRRNRETSASRDR